MEQNSSEKHKEHEGHEGRGCMPGAHCEQAWPPRGLRQLDEVMKVPIVRAITRPTPKELEGNIFKARHASSLDKIFGFF